MTRPSPAHGPLIAAMMNFGIDGKVRVVHLELGQRAAAGQALLGLARPVGGGAGADRLQAAHVGAGAEAAARTGQDDGPDLGVGAGRVHGVLEVEMHLAGPGIEPVRPVQRDRADAVGDVIENGFVGHRRVSSCAFLLRRMMGKTRRRYKCDKPLQMAPACNKWHPIGRPPPRVRLGSPCGPAFSPDGMLDRKQTISWYPCSS